MNVAIFWDIAPCSRYVNRCFGGTYHLHLQGRKIGRATNLATCYTKVSCSADFRQWWEDHTLFRNVGSYTEYTALYPRRRQHSNLYPVMKTFSFQNVDDIRKSCSFNKDTQTWLIAASNYILQVKQSFTSRTQGSTALLTYLAVGSGLSQFNLLPLSAAEYN
jgi:hypothetical protein